MSNTDKPKPGRYQHYKGHYYDVIDVATHSENETQLVVYRPCYGERALWVRPLAMFMQSVDVNGKAIPRFRYVGPTDTNE